MFKKLNDLLKSGVDPKWIVVLAWLVGVQKGIGQGAISLTNMVPDGWIPHIIAWNNGLAWLGVGLMGLLAALSSNATGPLISNISLPSIDTTKAVAKILIAAFVLSVLLAGSPAMATPKAKAASPVVCDPLNLLPGCTPAAGSTASSPTDLLQSLMDKVAKVEPTIITNVVNAINEADSDAATLTNPSDPTSFRDPISHACYPAQVKFLQSLPQVQAISSPAPYNLIVLYQRKRDLVTQIKAGLPSYLKVGCAAMLQDEAQIFIQTLGMIGVTVGAGALTGVFPAAAPLALPALAL